jgi:hypothetical protein
MSAKLPQNPTDGFQPPLISTLGVFIATLMTKLPHYLRQEVAQMSRIKNISRRCLGMLLMIYMTGCSFMVPWNQNFSVASEPPGARVTVNGKVLGSTPLTYTARRYQQQSVIVAKEGYVPQTRATAKTVSRVGIADLIGGSLILLPFLGLLAPGAWEQNPENITFVLDPVQGPDTAGKD